MSRPVLDCSLRFRAMVQKLKIQTMDLERQEVENIILIQKILNVGSRKDLQCDFCLSINAIKKR
jgi:hypothetical protein